MTLGIRPPPICFINCMLCNGVVSFVDRDPTKFVKHLQSQHEVHFNFELLLKINLLEKEDIEKIMSKYSYEESDKGMDDLIANTSSFVTKQDENNTFRETINVGTYSITRDSLKEEGKFELGNSEIVEANQIVDKEVKTICSTESSNNERFVQIENEEIISNPRYIVEDTHNNKRNWKDKEYLSKIPIRTFQGNNKVNNTYKFKIKKEAKSSEHSENKYDDDAKNEVNFFEKLISLVHKEIEIEPLDNKIKNVSEKEYKHNELLDEKNLRNVVSENGMKASSKEKLQSKPSSLKTAVPPKRLLMSKWSVEEKAIYNMSLQKGQCVSCGKSPRRSMLQHIKFYIDDTLLALEARILDCKKCNIALTSINEVMSHHKTVHNEPIPYKCPQCDSRFENFILLLGHIKVYHKGIPIHKCYQCSDKYYKITSLGLHLKKVHGMTVNFKPRKRYYKKCTICGKNVEKVEYHMKMKHGPKVYTKCEICGKRIRDIKTAITAHMTNHSKKNEHECGDCHKKFVNNFSLRSHRLSFHIYDSSGGTCDQCGKMFNNQRKVIKHKQWAHSGKIFTCEICKKYEGRKYDYKKHYLVCSKTTDFICLYENCKIKYFRDAHSLKKHTDSVHLGIKEKPTQFCEHCGKGFRGFNKVKIHMRLHTGERPFQCSVCGKGFFTKTMLEIHTVSHSDVKPFQCQYCQKGFSQGSTLTTHLRTHTGEKFACKSCGKAFVKNAFLKKHYQQLDSCKSNLENTSV